MILRLIDSDLDQCELLALEYGESKKTGEGCLNKLRRLPEFGVNFIDTADSYGPEVSENLIREALYTYEGLLVATKAGLTRHRNNIWAPLGRPEYLKQCILMSMRRLNVEQIDLWQLHRIDPKVPRDEQFEAIAEFQKEGLIKHIGLSKVRVEEIQEAQKYCTVVTVQNQFNLLSRKYEAEVNF